MERKLFDLPQMAAWTWLQVWARRPKTAQALALRSRIILGCSDARRDCLAHGLDPTPSLDAQGHDHLHRGRFIFSAADLLPAFEG
jgi:hypothetical protein